MRFNLLILLLIASCLYLALGQVSYDDCCLEHVKSLSRGTKRMAVRYTRQETDGGCNIPAIIFIMKKGRKYCTDERQEWVRDLMRRVDNRIISGKNGRRGPKRH